MARRRSGQIAALALADSFKGSVFYLLASLVSPFIGGVVLILTAWFENDDALHLNESRIVISVVVSVVVLLSLPILYFFVKSHVKHKTNASGMALVAFLVGVAVSCAIHAVLGFSLAFALLAANSTLDHGKASVREVSVIADVCHDRHLKGLGRSGPSVGVNCQTRVFFGGAEHIVHAQVMFADSTKTCLELHPGLFGLAWIKKGGSHECH